MTTAPPSSPSAPLIEAQGLRVDTDGCPICEQLSLRADGQRVVLAGEGAQAIGDAIAMQAALSAGTLRFDGLDVAKAQHIGRVGIAPLDPPLPPRMTVHGYISLSLRTVGFDEKTAVSSAAASLSELGLSSLAGRRTESLAIPERRAAVLAAAVLPGARSLLTIAPLHGLEGPASQYVLAVMGHVSRLRRVLATAIRFDAATAERDLIMGATHVVLVDRTDVLWSGTSDDLVRAGPLLSVAVRGQSDALIVALRELGLTVYGSPPRFTVSRRDDTTPGEVLALAERTGTTVVEIMPIVAAMHAEPPASSEPSAASSEVMDASTADQEQTP